MGEVFAGRFELIDSVAAGGMGEVWTARDLRDGSVVAVKLLKQADAGGLLRFMREQALRIHHEHILTPLAWAGIDDRVLFSMPLARGGSVADLMKLNGPLPQRFAAELLRQTLDGLGAVHAAGVVHRDVKPANLLLEATGTDRPWLLLSDFGVALPLDEPRLTTQALVIGTPGYLAPEQAAGGDAAPDQDLYAVGMVGKELLSGVRPKRDGSAAQTPPAGTDPGLWQLLERLTALNPAARPSLAEAQAVLQTPALAWEPQSRITVAAKIRPDGHLAGTGADPYAGDTVRAPRGYAASPSAGGAPLQPGGPSYQSGGPSYQPGGPSYQPGGPSYQPGGASYQPGGPSYQPSGPSSHQSAGTNQPSGPSPQPSGPGHQPSAAHYPPSTAPVPLAQSNGADDATTFRPERVGTVDTPAANRDLANDAAATSLAPAAPGRSAATRATGTPARGRRVVPLVLIVLGLLMIVAAIIVAISQ